jgi:molybdopterin synthase catalytic subunit
LAKKEYFCIKPIKYLKITYFLMNQHIEIILSDKTLNEQACSDFVKNDESGGIVTFVGTVRNQTKGKRVLRLDFEAYEPMAVSEMRKIAEQAVEKFSLKKIAIYHRVGNLEIGEVPVVIAASAAHRGAAFDACEYAIDMLKETVPIWKKEIFEDGEVWVSATP